MDYPTVPQRKEGKQKSGFLSFIKGPRNPSPDPSLPTRNAPTVSKPALPEFNHIDEFSANDFGDILRGSSQDVVGPGRPVKSVTYGANRVTATPVANDVRHSANGSDRSSDSSAPSPRPNRPDHRGQTPDRSINLNANISELSNARARQLSQKVNFTRTSASVSPSRSHIAEQDARHLGSSQQRSPSLPSHSPNPNRSGSQTSSNDKTKQQRTREPRDSQESFSFSLSALPPLQIVSKRSSDPKNDTQGLTPIREDDPNSYELVRSEPRSNDVQRAETILEERADLLYSPRHLDMILEDPTLLNTFAQFLASRRSSRLATFNYYLDALKATRAIEYTNSIARDLDSRRVVIAEPIAAISNISLRQRLDRAFASLLDQDLPAFVAHQWTSIVSASARYRITGTMPEHLRNASNGLAEVFCLTDPRQEESPIVFCSQEFTRTTQYGLGYAIGRNCRFLQGHGTNPAAVQRISAACREARDHTEVLLNYRRDGSPFLNMLMLAPLFDADGELKYIFGAQVDVSGLLLASAQLEGLARLLEPTHTKPDQKTDFDRLAELFNTSELSAIRKYGGKMQQQLPSTSHGGKYSPTQRVVLTDPLGADSVLDDASDNGDTRSVSKSSVRSDRAKSQGRLPGIYEHYLLVRPAPSLRIIFTSPSLQSHSLLQANFLDCIGGSTSVREELARVLQEGRGVTAKVRWLGRPQTATATASATTVDPFYSIAVEGSDVDGEGSNNGSHTKDHAWIHCTPMLDASRDVGVWVVLLVREEPV